MIDCPYDNSDELDCDFFDSEFLQKKSTGVFRYS